MRLPFKSGPHLQVVLLLFIQAVVCSINQTLVPFENLPSKFFYFKDSEAVLYHDGIDQNVWVSPDEGKTWAVAKNVPKGVAIDMFKHPFDSQTAFIITSETTQYKTHDQGKTWKPIEMHLPPSTSDTVFGFHAERPNYIIYSGVKCHRIGGFLPIETCQDEAYVTKDSFDSKPQLLLSNVSKCIWGRSSPNFQNIPVQTIYCLEFQNDSDSIFKSTKSVQLMKSEDYFVVDKKVIHFDNNQKIDGIIGLALVQDFLTVAVKHANSEDLELYISTDGLNWAEAKIPHDHNLKEDAFTILESSAQSLMISIAFSNDDEYASLYRSNSNGTYFTPSLKYNNRDRRGIVDFEKVEGIEGIALANIVKNHESLDRNPHRISKNLQTQITFDDGASWKFIKPPKNRVDGDSFLCQTDQPNEQCALHLHSVTQLHNNGRVYSSLSASGILMGVGNVGPHLKPYDQGDTFISTDGGIHWENIKLGPYKYEFGDKGSILVMIDDSKPTDELLYSLDRAKSWKSLRLDKKIRPKILTTDPESSSQSFIILSTIQEGSERGKHYLLHIDFSNLGRRKCVFDESKANSMDFERWYARAEADGPECLMGHKTAFWRRKADVDCYVGEKFKDPVVIMENCPCTESDYECDYNYLLKDGKCFLVGPEKIPPNSCQDGKTTYQGSSGYRKIPSNTCDHEKGKQLDKPVEKSCDDHHDQPHGSDNVKLSATDFEHQITSYFYFPKSEHVLAQTSSRSIHKSTNAGANWTRILDEAEIVDMIQNPYNDDKAYFISRDKVIHYTNDKAETFQKFNVPAEPNIFGTTSLNFHPENHDWLLYIGAVHCESHSSNNCHAEAFLSTDHGNSWKSILSYVNNCSWVRTKTFTKSPEKLILCEHYSDRNGSQRNFLYKPLQLVSSEDFFETHVVLFKNSSGYAVFEDFLIATQNDDQGYGMRLKISMNGQSFADAHFPGNTHTINNAYTVLSSRTDSLTLHVTLNDRSGSEWGTLFNSNWNGTYFVTSLEHVNRDERGLVDFERMAGIDGIALVNQLANPKDANFSGHKQLKTLITFDNGSRWKALSSPHKDANGNAYNCSDCSLHLHSFTERKDPVNIFSSESAPGLMMGVGNVGEYLLPYRESNTYLTRDGGASWQEIQIGAHLYEFGDHGGILVLVDDEEPTNHILYSVDQGTSFKRFQFTHSNEKIRIQSLTTEPKSTSRKFILFGKTPGRNPVHKVFQIDFSNLLTRKCVLDTKNEDDDDFERWSPAGLRDDQCLFGRKIEYYRRLPDKICYVGEEYQPAKEIITNCQCTEHDFECDYNFVRDGSGNCVLVPGLEPRKTSCEAGEDSFSISSGYRKIPSSTCQGGLDLAKQKQVWCPGNGPSFGRIFLTVLIPVFAVVAIVLFMLRKHNLLGYGRIRLEDSPSRGFSVIQQAFDRARGLIDWDLILALLHTIRLPRAITSWFQGARYSRLSQDSTSEVFLDEFPEEDDNDVLH